MFQNSINKEKRRDPTVSHHNPALNCQYVLTGICFGHFMLKALSEDPSVCACLCMCVCCIHLCVYDVHHMCMLHLSV